MSPLVIDASVAIKWFVPEVHSEAARRLLGAPGPYFAPDLLFAETSNVIWKKVRLSNLRPHDFHKTPPARTAEFVRMR